MQLYLLYLYLSWNFPFGVVYWCGRVRGIAIVVSNTNISNWYWYL